MWIKYPPTGTAAVIYRMPRGSDCCPAWLRLEQEVLPPVGGDGGAGVPAEAAEVEEAAVISVGRGGGRVSK